MLTTLEKKVLLKLSQQQTEKQNLVIFTDVERDHDGEVALTIVAGLLKLELVNIKALITCLQPAEKRAQLNSSSVKIFTLLDGLYFQGVAAGSR